MTAFAFATLLAIQSWKSLQPGVDFAMVNLEPQGTLYVVRVGLQ